MLFLYNHRPYTFPQILSYRPPVRGVSVSERLRLSGVHIPFLRCLHIIFYIILLSFHFIALISSCDRPYIVSERRC